MDSFFHPAMAAIVAGDLEQLSKLLEQTPELATRRSSCSHPTLMQCLVLTDPAPAMAAEIVRLLAEYGSVLDEPLIAAGSYNHDDVIAALLDAGGNIEGDGRWSPLEEGLYWGAEQTAAFLVKRGARVDNLRKAAALGRMDYLQTCFDEAGALKPKIAGRVEWPFGKPLPAEVVHDPRQIVNNALIYAAAWGREDVVRFLLERGAEINAIPAGFDFAGTALHYAALRGRRSMCELLLAHGADPSIRDTRVNAPPEGWASHEGHDELAAWLQEQREGSTDG